jgi:hypothetical protein
MFDIRHHKMSDMLAPTVAVAALVKEKDLYIRRIEFRDNGFEEHFLFVPLTVLGTVAFVFNGDLCNKWCYSHT